MHDERMMTAFRGLHQALRQLRIESGMTQADLADAAGIGRATIQAYESGRRKPRVETLESLLGAMDVGLEDLTNRLRNGAPAKLQRWRFREPTTRRPNRRHGEKAESIGSIRGFLTSMTCLMLEKGNLL